MIVVPARRRSRQRVHLESTKRLVRAAFHRLVPIFHYLTQKKTVSVALLIARRRSPTAPSVPVGFVELLNFVGFHWERRCSGRLGGFEFANEIDEISEKDGESSDWFFFGCVTCSCRDFSSRRPSDRSRCCLCFQPSREREKTSKTW